MMLLLVMLTNYVAARNVTSLKEVGMTADRSEFNEWFNQLEAYCLKSERFYQELDCVSKEVLAISMVRWLEAAFYAGKLVGEDGV